MAWRRRILLSIPSGSAVDEAEAALLPLLEAGDIIIDGGNEHFTATQRRTQALWDGAKVHHVARTSSCACHWLLCTGTSSEHSVRVCEAQQRCCIRARQ